MLQRMKFLSHWGLKRVARPARKLLSLDQVHVTLCNDCLGDCGKFMIMIIFCMTPCTIVCNEHFYRPFLQL